MALLNPVFWLLFDERGTLGSILQLYCNVNDIADLGHLASSVYAASSAALGGALSPSLLQHLPCPDFGYPVHRRDRQYSRCKSW